MGQLLASISSTSGTCRSRRASARNNERVAHRPMVDAHIGRMFASLDRDACAAKLRRANVAYGFVNDCEGLRDHPALRRVAVETEQGPIAIGAPPARLSDGPATSGPVPSLGQHSAAIRAEFGGLTVGSGKRDP